MSSPHSRPASGTPKAMSSRLLTMKFMQRAAASTLSSPATQVEEEPAPKRRKKNPDRPCFNVDELANKRAVEKAIAEEEAKRQAALEKEGAAAGDTHWVLNFEDQKDVAVSKHLSLRVVSTRSASIEVGTPQQVKMTDEDDSSGERSVMIGRRSFGRFNKKLEKQMDPTLKSSSDESEEEGEKGSDGSDFSDGDNSVDEMIRATQKEAVVRAKKEQRVKQKATKAAGKRMSKERREKEVNLNGLVSLSGRAPSRPVLECYSCGGPHRRQDCHKQKRGPPEGDSGNNAKKPRHTRGMVH
ncbi:hypothetical protein BJ878DRAFT_532895 [Calycina marina]|uniref:Uncharacterized protein n=1 Tax=Calycina marina TaxID=1763456 RepID=A0A9P8CH65_9HELO|nr:hypothetical protein BJ878DRAFT_532895 [Calycina marina]